MHRLLQPLLKTDGQFQTISFEEAYEQIAAHSKLTDNNRTLVMASGDYSNEELYLIQRVARTGLRTNAIGSFDYYKRGTSFFIDKNDIVPFAELFGAGKFYTLLDPQSNALSQKTALEIMEACPNTSRYDFNTPGHLNIRNFGDFFRCINQYILRNDLAKGIYVQGLGKNFEAYKKQILMDDGTQLLASNQLTEEEIRAFAEQLLRDEAPVFVMWERFLDKRGVIELENLCMLLDIQAKPSSGFLCLKAELNSQGLFDMGLFPDICVGGEPFDDGNRQLMEELYGQPAHTASLDLSTHIATHDFDQCYLFNATGADTPQDIMETAKHCSWSVLQTAYWDDKPEAFDLILPASMPEECDGTFTDSARAAHTSKADATCPIAVNNIKLFSNIGTQFGLPKLDNATDVFMEYISFFKGGCRSKLRHFFR
ncbi:MAG: hypothetical protein IKZ52_04675 [Bacteroidales bacterium]|nr:hypothetical protein [Bacteroidales bacterium]